MPPKKGSSPPMVAASGSRRKRPDAGDVPQGTDTGEGGGSHQEKRQKKDSEPSAANASQASIVDYFKSKDPQASTKKNSKASTAKNSKSTAAKGAKDATSQDSEASTGKNSRASDEKKNTLDTNLPPISDADTAFYDMVGKELAVVKDVSPFVLRVATMCSGTEAPIIALSMIREMFRRHVPEKDILRISHLFSVEIEHFKQSYIARNTEGAILFNNLLDFVNPKDGKAPTAMGSMVKIPDNVDVLVSGCSCVDFSTLNTQKAKDFFKGVIQNELKIQEMLRNGGYQEDRDFEILEHLFKLATKDIDNLGTSGQTFFAMMHYVRDYRPKIVVLENVQGAPWDKTEKVWFPFLRYAALHVSLDTKDFYIPQTRSRGYLIALDLDVFGVKLAGEILARWRHDVKQVLPRRASGPINLWLLSPAHPLTERARQDDSEKALRPASDSDWERSKARHTRLRKSEGFGDERPVTRWGQPGPPYDRLDRLVFHSQPNRVKDFVDINQLRGERIGRTIGLIQCRFDFKFKMCVIDLSQNVDRSSDMPFGMTGCITPNGIHFITDQCRFVSGFEVLRLQGLPIDRLQFATETQDQLRDLAGNAMSTTVVGAVLLGLLEAIHYASNNQHSDPPRGLNKFFATPLKNVVTNNDRLIVEPTQKYVTGFSTMTAQPFQKASMIQLYYRSRRYCFCNGSAKYSTDDFLQCTVCSTIRCRWCAGNPPHSFGPTKRPSDFLLLSEVEQALMRFLPGRIVNLIPVNLSSMHIPGPLNTLIPHYERHMRKLQSTTFYYRSTHVTEVITACYIGQAGFELRAVLSEKGITWYLYLDAWSDLGMEFADGIKENQKSEGPAYKNLVQPIAKAMVTEDAQSVLPALDSWRFWCFEPLELGVDIMVSESILEITNVAVKDANKSNHPSSQFEAGLESVCGRYFHQPCCDGPEKSLHVSTEKNLFLFKDVTKTGSPEKDGYVISEECRPLETHEYREVLIRFKDNEDLRQLESGLVSAKTNGYWVTPHTFSIDASLGNENAARKVVEKVEIPNSKSFVIHHDDPAQYVLVQASTMREIECDGLKVMNKHRFMGQNEWTVVEKSDLHYVNDFISHLNAKLAGVEGLEVRFELAGIETSMHILDAWKTQLDPRDCHDGHLPRKQWLQKGSKYAPHHHSEAMAAFERHSKTRIPTFEMRLERPGVVGDMFTVNVQYLIYPSALGRKAAAYLPPSRDPNAKLTACVQVQRNVVVSENMQVDSKAPDKHRFESFRASLKSLAGYSYPVDPLMGRFRKTLTASQLRSLGWMLSRERSNTEFTEEEIEEEIVSSLKLRIVGRAQRKICHHGGVLADDVGYGKTVITLALMHTQQEFDQANLKQRMADNPHCTHLKATLAIVPHHLVDQWKTETEKCFPARAYGVVIIKNMRDLEDDIDLTKLRALREARLIIVDLNIFAKRQYHNNLAKWAGSLEPSWTFDNRDGRHRAFEDWYDDAMPAVQRHVHTMFSLAAARTVNAAAIEKLYQDIEGRREERRKVYECFISDYKQRPIVKTKTSRYEVLKEKPDTSKAFTSLKELIPKQDVSPRSREDRSESESTYKAEPLKESCFTHLLEAFEFSRVVFDEYSYGAFPASMIFANLKARSKWAVSATPPIRNLADVQSIASLINVHVARPVYRRQGMPRITEGPELREKTNAEDLESRKFMTDQSVRERHERAENFLKFFAIANPLDLERSGGIKVEEKVVVCEMSANEFSNYMDLEQEMRSCGFDVHMLPKEPRRLLRTILDFKRWSADGRAIAIEALFACSSWGNWNNRTDPHTSLPQEREDLRQKALVVFGYHVDKAIWLSKRITDNNEESTFDNAANCVFDVCTLLRDIWSRDLEACCGFDAWSRMWEAMIRKGDRNYDSEYASMKSKYPDFLSTEKGFEKRLLKAINEFRTTSWHDYYDLNSTDLKDMEESEAADLVQDLVRARGPLHHTLVKETNLKTLRALVNDEVRGLESMQRIAIVQLQPDPEMGKNLLQGLLRKVDYQALCNSVSIAFSASDKNEDLARRLRAHRDGILDISAYKGYSNCQMGKSSRFPGFGTTVSVRGGKYTYTRSDVSDASLELRKAWEHVISTIKQERIAKNLASSDKVLFCDGCGVLKLREDLYFVCDCGHLLCADHIDAETCGQSGFGERSFCPSVLKNAVIPLSKTRPSQRVLGPQFGTASPAPSHRISAKSQMIANVIKGIPLDECAILFAQYEAQIAELAFTLQMNGIDFTQNPERSRTNIWRKVRLLQIDSEKAAGTNLQNEYNHVMFACPLSKQLQSEYDSIMKQARGRCIRYGQKKTVHVYHFVTANTIEVDILELRKQSHVLVRPGQAIGRLQPVPPAGDNNSDVNNYDDGAEKDHMPYLIDLDEDTVMVDAAPDVVAPSAPSNLGAEERVKSMLTSKEIWRVMNEQNWLTTVGIDY